MRAICSICSFVFFIGCKPILTDNNQKELCFSEKKENPHAFANTIFKESEYNYLKPLNCLLLNEDYYREIDAIDFYYQTLLTFSSFANDSLVYFDTYSKRFKSERKNNQYKFDTLKIIDGKSFVINKAKSERVIMFNEQHYRTNQRFFLKSLLQDFKELGYNYLALEAADNTNFRENYILNHEEGFYLNEPNFANLVAEASKLGFKIKSYESNIACVDSKNCYNFRDSIQAINLNKILKDNKEAKIIVLAGGSHIYEKSSRNKNMAQYFKELTGINPFTVDQISLVDNHTNNNSFYYQANSNFDIKSPSVILTVNDSIYKYDGRVDLSLIYPLNNQQNWMCEDKSVIDIKLKKQYNRLIFQAFKRNDIQKVPVFNKVIYPTDTKLKLNLERGNYFYIIKDQNDKVFQRENFEIQ